MTSGHAKLQKEVYKLARFVVVGASTFLLQTALYFIFSRWLFTHVPHTVSYILALVYSLAYNYSLNRLWTFGDQSSAKGSAWRYSVVAVTASAICAVLFWIGHDLLHFYDLYVVVMVNLLIPFYTFVAHRLYTFHEQPHRHLQKFVRSTPR
ncbi:MAG: GtrA family protein [Patescibacteria group bacterium]|nr:GtrA family protein [Patescibacteria group bacterium]